MVSGYFLHLLFGSTVYQVVEGPQLICVRPPTRPTFQAKLRNLGNTTPITPRRPHKRAIELNVTEVDGSGQGSDDGKFTTYEMSILNGVNESDANNVSIGMGLNESKFKLKHL